MIRASLLALALAALLPDARAQELYGALGGIRPDSPETHSFAWVFSYHHVLGEHLDASFSWLNEGHIPNHHRDGHSVQLWAKARPFSPQLTLALGVGAYRYFDTTVAETPGASYSDDHGVGLLYSLRGAWTTGRWIYQARLDRVETKKSIDTTALMLGLGYKLDQDGAAVYRSSTNLRDELTVYLGASIVNSFESQHDVATSIEYRHAFGPVLRGSLAWLYEGDTRLIRRNGVVTQGWLEPSFSGDRLTVGVGVGAYIAVDEYREEEGGAFLTGIVTVGASYRVGREWTARFAWHRILTNYDRDADIILLGAGYRF